MKPEEVEDELRKAIEGTVDIYQDSKLLAPVSCFCKTELNQGLLLNGIDHCTGWVRLVIWYKGVRIPLELYCTLDNKLQ